MAAKAGSELSKREFRHEIKIIMQRHGLCLDAKEIRDLLLTDLNVTSCVYEVKEALELMDQLARKKIFKKKNKDREEKKPDCGGVAIGVFLRSKNVILD